MNVTPLVDVVLVLLIIFMVLTAVLNDHFWVNVPEKDRKEEKIEEPGSEADAPLVVTVNGRGRIQINRDEYPDEGFGETLKRMLVARGDRKIYFDAHDGVPFARAVQVMDLARGGGAAHVAVLTEKLD
jgi:biopolymer transport protein ExbD